MMQSYIGTKQVSACAKEKDGQPGYEVQYADGYVSWSPKDVFEAAYLPIGKISHLAPHEQRLIGEAAQLNDRVQKLKAFTASEIFAALPKEDRMLMLFQHQSMINYLEALATRLERVKALYVKPAESGSAADLPPGQ